MRDDDRLATLERQLSTMKRWLAISALGWGSVLVMAAAPHVMTPDVIRAKGIVVEDAAGRPRILIGSPLPSAKGRQRPDRFDGIAYLDASGKDRLTFGQLPDPMTAEGRKPRRVGGAGILLHDRAGLERGGYSVLDDETALLTVDYPRGAEGVAVSSSEKSALVGAFHRGEGYREAVTLGAIETPAESFVKFGDPQGTERLRLSATGGGGVRIKRFDASGTPKADARLDP